MGARDARDDLTDRNAPRSVALITSIAYSLANFRGPLIEAMVAAGLEVYALAPDFDPRTRAAVSALGARPVDIRLERTGMAPFRDLIDMVRLVLVLRRLKPDIVFSYFVKPVIYGTIAARFAGIRQRFALVAGLGYIFAPLTGGGDRKRRVLQWIVSRLYGVAFALCECVFFQNGDDIAHFVDAGRIRAGKVVRLNGTGVDLARFQAAPPQLAPIRFLLMARLLREKGIEDYVEAARIVRQSHPNVEFILLGGTDPNPGGLTEAEIRQWVDEGLIRWEGHVDDVLPAIRESSVYVLPSYYREGVPRSIQEAMALSRPIITTDWIGCRETVVDKVNGFLVPIRDPQALADAMEAFIAQPEMIEEMGRESRKLAEIRFDTDRINAKILRAMDLVPVGALAG